MTDLTIRVHAFLTSTLISMRGRLSEERGQDLLEWVLLSGLIAAAIIGLVAIFTPFLNDMATNVGQCLDFNSATACNPGF